MAANQSEIPSSDPGPPVRPAPPLQPERSAQPASAEQPARRRTKRFWNWKLICAEFIVATMGIGGFIILRSSDESDWQDWAFGDPRPLSSQSRNSGTCDQRSGVCVAEPAGVGGCRSCLSDGG